MENNINLDEFPLKIEQIMECIPHRYPFLLVDRVIGMTEKTMNGYKNLSFNEPFFQGHFPGIPVMPGVLIVEALAQIGAVFYKKLKNIGDDHLFLFAGIDNAKFRRPVVPGDKLDLEVELIKSKLTFVKFHGKASVDGEIACEADMSASAIKK